MAHETGSATSVLDLLDKLKDFLVAEGWTVNRYDSPGTGRRLQVQLSTDVFFNLRAHSFEFISTTSTAGSCEGNNGVRSYGLFVNGSTGYSSGSDWFNQAGAYQDTNSIYRIAGIEGLSGAIVSYSFFQFDECVYVVVEYPAGRFAWLGFGRLTKTDTYGGGQFFFGKHAPGASVTTNIFPFAGASWAGMAGSRAFLRLVAVDGFTGWAPSFNLARAGEPRCGDTVQKMQSLWHVSPNTFNSLSVLFPVAMIVTRDGSTFAADTPFSIMGYLAGLHFVNIRFLVAGESYSVASDTYRVFSFHEQHDETANASPNFTVGNMGFAAKTN